MRKHTEITVTAEINRILLRAATNADPIVDCSQLQKDIRIAKMRAQLTELGFSIVTTEWLNATLKEQAKAE